MEALAEFLVPGKIISFNEGDTISRIEDAATRLGRNLNRGAVSQEQMRMNRLHYELGKKL